MNPRTINWPNMYMRIIIAKIPRSKLVELTPPVKRAILGIDVSTIIATITRQSTRKVLSLPSERNNFSYLILSSIEIDLD
jgi:hypothetical protein